MLRDLRDLDAGATARTGGLCYAGCRAAYRLLGENNK
jgi:hypothetical protein